MEENQRRKDHNKVVERAEDVRARTINQMVVVEEDQLDAEHKRQKQEILKGVWNKQEEIKRVKDITEKKYAKLLV